ncbi:hypothetical protein CYMTET_43851 [Cymbomonas tetramitiformis]|uniref:RNA-directed DNA polymerase n=1 Tax=Cymbomonas tetramitiformis TaxID=36881 RepID=A0AAE0C2L7_9CHLO|nr:hypothetical protein CYMTET_43851 [Cymbomonas tetramitiformis]
MERSCSEGDKERRRPRNRVLWKAGQRRSDPVRSGSSVLEGRKNEREKGKGQKQSLAQLKRVQEFRRRRHEALSEQPPRAPPLRTDRAVDRSGEMRREWLTKGRARQVVGLGRRPWLDRFSKKLRDSDLQERHNFEMESGERPREAYLSELEREADLHAFARQEQDEIRCAFLRECDFEHWNERVKGRIEAKRDTARAAAIAAQTSPVYPIAKYPPDQPVKDVVQQATGVGLLADACTVHLPFDPDSESEEATPPVLASLLSVTQNGELSSGWCEALSAVSDSRAPPRAFCGHGPTPTLLLFWAWIGNHRVKCLVDSGASTDLVASSTVQRIPELSPSPHERPMRVRVADGKAYDANSCVRPRLRAETTKGTYQRQVELRVMPLDLCVDIILGGPWLASLSPVTLDYKGWGSVRFRKGREEVVISGCSPGTPESGRPKDTAMSLVSGTILGPRRARKDLRALRSQGEDAFVVYLGPEGVFGAAACNPEEGGDSNESPNNVLQGLESEPPSEDSAPDSDPESEGLSTGTRCPAPSAEESQRYLESVSAAISELRPQGFGDDLDAGDLADESDNDEDAGTSGIADSPDSGRDLTLEYFASKREAMGAFALLPAEVRRRAIEDHAQGLPPTWHAQAAAALGEGRRLLQERKSRHVHWSDSATAESTSPTLGQAGSASHATTSAPTAQTDKDEGPRGQRSSVPSDVPLEDDIDETVSSTVWQQLRDLEKEFEDVICTELPASVQSRPYKASIRLSPEWDSRPLHRRGYKLSQEELRQLRQQLDELLAKGYIRPSASPWGSPVLMVPKPSNPQELRLVIDYRQINEITVKDKYPLPDVQSLLDDLQGAKVFSTADALWGFWQVPMRAEDVEKTAMTTHFGAYEWLVMPMGLSNSPSTWQRMMMQYLGHLPFVRVFVDDILIFSETPEAHVEHLRLLLAACRDNEIYLKKSKLKLCKRACRFLGHVLDRDGCRPQQDKVASVRDWPDLESVTHVRQFLGMCGFYRRYIQSFAHMAHPLTRLTKSGVEWTWGDTEKQAFQRLKEALISAPTLALPDQKAAAEGSKPFCVQTDASAVALGGVLMQDLGRGLQPIAFESRQFSSAEQNYHAGERELCAIHHCTTVAWRHYLIFTNFKLMGDHKPLHWLFAPARELSRRQARWYEDLVEVGVHRMEHVPGRCLVVPDAQSRRPDYQQLSAREGLKEKGIVDRTTDAPRQEGPAEVSMSLSQDPAKAPVEAMLGAEDPTSVLDDVFESEGSGDESFPPVGAPPVVGELTWLNGLTWIETPDLWQDAVDTLAVAEQALGAVEIAAPVTTRSGKHKTGATESQEVPVESSEPRLPQEPSPKKSSHYDHVVDRQDWKLIKERFDEIVAQYGPFDVDACCDSMGVNRQVSTYWTDCLKEQWRGKHVWCNPPYTKDSDLIEKILRHFLSEWRADPENTSAMFLLPDYDAPWRRLIHPKYGLHPVKVFDTKDEKGRPVRLFESPDGGRPPLRWPVILVWAPAAGRTRPRAPPKRRAETDEPCEPLVTSGEAAKVRAATGPLRADKFVQALRAEYERSSYLRTLREELLAAPHQRTDTFRMVDDVMWRVAEGRYQLVLSPDSPLRELVLREAHESPAAGHTGRDKTLDRVSRRFWWPRMSRDVSDWCKSCVVCQQTRPRNSYPDGQLNPLQVPVRLWQVVSIDFVTGLPRTERGYDAFATFTDKLSKMVHVVPMLYSDSSAAQVARMYFDHVWRLHGAPMKIVCDRDSRFRDEMHLELHRLMGVQVASTTPYHPQGDGQAEHTNHTVERMLRAYVAANQQDWDLWCTPVEYAINDSRSAVTGFTPFELTYGHAPASQLDFFVEAALASRRGRAKGGRGVVAKKGTAHETARQFVRQLQLARDKLLLAQQQQITQYDARHRARSYAVGDKVWVDASHLTQPGDRGLHKKLLKKRLGPLEVLECFHSDRQMALPAGDRGAPSAYRLKLPPQWKVHDVFTADRLTPVESCDRFVERTGEVPPPPVQVSGRKEMHVESIERSRERQRHGKRWTEYLVKWTGLPRSENEWKTREDLEWDGAGKPGVPNRALIEFERVEAKMRQREKARVEAPRSETLGVSWVTEPQTLSVDSSMPWVPEERFDEETGVFARVSSTNFAPEGSSAHGAARLEKVPLGPVRILVLFCGTGSVERQFAKQFPNCEVTTVDIQPKWQPTHCDDILRWDYKQYKPKYFDVIWASPPCTEYSQAKTIGERDLRQADRRVRRTVEIIQYLQPDFYFIENPRGRAPHGLHSRRCMHHLPPPHLTMYCKYGAPYKKPTHIWTNARLRVPLLQCDANSPCEHKQRHGCHAKVAQGGSAYCSSGNVRSGMGSKENVYGIPAPLLEQLFEPIALANDAAPVVDDGGWESDASCYSD